MRQRLPVLLIFSLLSMVNAVSQTKEAQAEGAAVKKDLMKLFKSCKAGRYAEAAGHIVYRGPDAKRKWMDIYDYSQPTERTEVEGVCGNIKELVKESDAYEFSRFFEEPESEGRWLVWEMKFKKGAKQGAVLFAFLKIKGRYAVGDIDGHLAYLRAIK